jgi:hypothetical protein
LHTERRRLASSREDSGRRTEISLASVDEQLDASIDQFRQQTSRVVHAVTLEQERLVDLHVAGLELDLARNTELCEGVISGFREVNRELTFLDLGLVEVRLHPAHFAVAEL